MPKRKNPIAKQVRTPRFRPRIVRDRKKYTRKGRSVPAKYSTQRTQED